MKTMEMALCIDVENGTVTVSAPYSDDVPSKRGEIIPALKKLSISN